MPSELRNQLAAPDSTQPPPTAKLQDRCAYAAADGRRCLTLRSKDHPSLCARHAHPKSRNGRRAAAGSGPASNAPSPQLRSVGDLQPPMRNFAPELLGPVKDFQSAAAINHVLGRLLVLCAGNRMPSRNAGIIAYICQLLLQSLPGVKHEVREVVDTDFTEKELFKVIDSLPNLPPNLGSSKAAGRKP